MYHVAFEVPDKRFFALAYQRFSFDPDHGKPVVVTITDEQTGEDVQVYLGKFDVQLQIAFSLGRNNFLPSIPALIYKMDQGDFVEMGKRVYRTKSRGWYLSAMSIMMDGASGVSEKRLERIHREAEASILGNAMNFPFPELGKAWGAPDLGEDYRTPLKSKLPVLLISGTMDARTPIKNGEELARGLPNSQHVIVEGAGHGNPLLISSPIIGDIILEFLDGRPPSTLKIEGPKIDFNSIK